MKEFVAHRINNSNVYMIIRNSDDNCRFWNFPLKVYGFIEIEGCSYYYSRVSFIHVAEEATDYLDELKQDALVDFFEAK